MTAVASDPLPDGAIARLGSKRFACPSGEIFHFAIRSDGAEVAVIGEQVYRISLEDGAATLLPPMDRSPDAIAYTADGAIRIISSCFEIETYREGQLETQSLEDSDGSAIWYAVVLSADGRHAAATGGQEVRVWDADTGQVIYRKRHNVYTEADVNDNRAVAISPDGLQLAWGGTNGRIYLVSLETKEERAPLQSGLEPRTLVFCPSRSLLAVLPHESLLPAGELWDLQAGVRVAGDLAGSFQGGVAFSPDGSLMAAGSSTHTRIWQTQSWAEQFVIPIETPERYRAFAPDGAGLIGIAGSRVMLWDSETGDARAAAACDPCGAGVLALSADGGRLLLADGAKAALWQIEPAARFQHWLTADGRNVQFVWLGPEGEQLAILSAGGALSLLRLGEPEPTRPVALVCDPDPLRLVLSAAAISVDWRSVSVAEMDSTEIRVWNVGEDQPQWSLVGHAHTVYGLAYSGDGRWLASASYDQTVRLWDLASGQQQGLFRADGIEMSHHQLAFSPSGDRIAAVGFVDDPYPGDGAAEAVLNIWEVGSGTLLGTYRNWGGSGIRFAPDEESVLSTAAGRDGRRCLRAVIGNDELTVKQLPLELACAYSALAPDCAVLATSQRSGTVLLWDISDPPG